MSSLSKSENVLEEETLQVLPLPTILPSSWSNIKDLTKIVGKPLYVSQEANICRTRSEKRRQQEANYNQNHFNSTRNSQETIGISRLTNNIDSNIVICEVFINDPILQENCRREEGILQRIKKSLAGLPPPVSVTKPQIDMCNTVLQHKEEILNYLRDVQSLTLDGENQPKSTTTNSPIRPTYSLDETKEMTWRSVLRLRKHGIRFNLCTASETNEYLALSIIDRFVGCETTSSFRNSPSSANKRTSKRKSNTEMNSASELLAKLAEMCNEFGKTFVKATTEETKRSAEILQVLNDTRDDNKKLLDGVLDYVSRLNN